MPYDTSHVHRYLRSTDIDKVEPAFLTILSGLAHIAETEPCVARAVVQELSDQRANLKLIASENYSSLAVQFAMGNLLTDKYAEGYPGHRFYAGCANVDEVESHACSLAKALFGCEHAYVQPHSGADANLIAYWAILQTRIETPELDALGETNPAKISPEDWATLRHKLGNQRLLGMDYYAGGHLTHGYRHNISAMMFDAHSYGVDRQTGLLDYDMLEQMADEIRPLILLAGYSAYPRAIDFCRLRTIADKVGAVLMVDMAHFAGLVAGGVFDGDYSPFPHADVVTTTTHKTLRGPRGGMVLSRAEFAESLDKGCPLVMGGPLPHVIAAKAVALAEASKPGFREYAQQVVANARHLAQACMAKGLKIATGGTDNHLILVDVTPFGLTGRQAETAMRECGMTLNRNSLAFDSNGPWYTSGLRLGTPAITTLGMGREEIEEIAEILYLILKNTQPEVIQSGEHAGQMSRSRCVTRPAILEEAQCRVQDILRRFPVYPEIDLAFLKECFL